MRSQYLSRLVKIARMADANEQDWQVAAYTVRPQALLSLFIESENVWARAQIRVEIDQAPGQFLKQPCLRGFYSEVAQLDLRPGPGQLRFALEYARVVILVGQL
jgi:hypothetical protein